MSRPQRHITTLSDNEAKTIIEAVVAGHGTKGVSEDKIRAALKWANGVRSELALLDLVLEGRLAITSVKKGAFRSDELAFVERSKLS
jgi:hypothetical protein